MLSFLSLKLLFKKCYCSRLLLPKRLIPLNVSTCQREPEKKFRHQRDSNPGLSDTSWALYQLSYEAARWGRRVFRLRKDCQLIRFKTLICFIIFQVSLLSCCCLWVIWSLELSLWPASCCIVFAVASSQIEMTEKWITSMVYLRRWIYIKSIFHYL